MPPTSSLSALPGLHFLIHPLFNAAPGPFEHIVSENEFIARGRPDDLIYIGQEAIEEDLRIYPRLTEAYLERARALPPDEVLATFFSFAPDAGGPLRFFDSRFVPLFTGFLSELQDVMGARLLLFWRDQDPMLQPTASQVLIAGLAQMGFTVARDTPTSAFGETLGECIPRSVRNLRRGLGLAKFTRVDPLFTDLRFTWPDLSDAERTRWRHDLRSFGIVLHKRDKKPLLNTR